MSKASPFQENLNGGEISKRLRHRIGLNMYDISVDAMVGYVPMMEGGAEAAPGTIYVEAARGPCRLIPFDYNATQGHVIEASANTMRVYTNDARIEVGDPLAPLEIATPYSYAQVKQLAYAQSFDSLYLYHRSHPTQAFVRNGAEDFDLEPFAYSNGPFERENGDDSILVAATGTTGAVTLISSAPLFAAGDVGGLFRIRFEDFNSIRVWEPGMTVTNGQLVQWEGRVYQCISVGATLRTGSYAPNHLTGTKFDGLGGTDINAKGPYGVEWTYLYDEIGVLKITDFTDNVTVSATIERRLANVDPQHRWAFGSFSPKRGYPRCGAVHQGRKWVCLNSTLYGSVFGGFDDHSEFNERGESSADMAIVYPLDDADEIVSISAATGRLIVTTARASYAIEAGGQAQGLSPGNIRETKQNSSGAAISMPVDIDGRLVYIDRSRRNLIEADYDVGRGRAEPVNLTRYARHIGRARFMEIAEQKEPHQLLWAVLGDGGMAVAAYLPAEQVLGWARRSMATGMAARSICAITDPLGELRQIWLAVEYAGAWHVVRFQQFREDAEWLETDFYVDLAVEYQGVPASNFGPVVHFADQTIDAVADGRFYNAVSCDETGAFSLPEPASHVIAGLPYDAYITLLPIEAGGDSGPARHKQKRINRAVIETVQSRGLKLEAVRKDGSIYEKDFPEAPADAVPLDARPPMNGPQIFEDVGDWSRDAALTVRRVAPFASYIAGVVRYVEVEQR